MHQQGELDRAQALYEDVLEAQPGHPDALHLLGVLFIQREKYREAIDLIGRAIHRQPGNPAFYYNRGSAYHRLGDLEAAVRDYTKALELNPKAGDASYNRGNAYFALGRWQAAVDDYERALRVQPSYAEAWCNRGVALVRLAQFVTALASFDRAISLRADYAEAHCNRGTALRELKQSSEAVESYDRAIALRPDYAEAFSNRGIALQELGKIHDAVASYEQALALRPNYVEARYNYANALFNLGQLDAALAGYNRVIESSPDHAAAYLNRGTLWLALKQAPAAIADFDRFVQFEPENPAGYLNRGNARSLAGWLELAIADYTRGLELQPGSARLHEHRAGAWQKLRRFDEAVADYDRAIVTQSDSHIALWNKGLIHLLRGEFSPGWPLYEQRWYLDGLTPPEFPYPRWTGTASLEGKSIFVYAEQGLGDTLQFCRYLPLLAARGARVVFEVQPALVPLLGTLAGIATLLPRGEPRPACDFECPLLTLPSVFTRDFASIPAQARYLEAGSESVALWRARLGPRQRRRIGLVWRGNPRQANDRHRSTKLAELIPLLLPDAEYFSLQKDVTESENALLEAHGVHNLDRHLESFSDTAAVCELLDLVVSVCTSVAHLSAALGRPTWVLLTYGADWRWFCDRSDSPWYPTARLFRQNAPGDWSDVVCRARSALTEPASLNERSS